jgi:tRNA threonylcarbamoyl adenosine modification protein YeaZ
VAVLRPGGAESVEAKRGDRVEVVAQRVSVDARAHGELLAPAIQGVLGEAGVKPGELAAVVAGLGPGPFTGLRVGLVTAAAFGHSLGIPTYGVCSLDAIGWGLPGTVLAATDARRKELYWALYTDGVRVAGPGVDRPDVVAARAAEAGAVRVVGEGGHKYPLGLDVGEPRYPVPMAMAVLAADRVLRRAPSEPLTPLYLRRPDATLPGQQRKSVLQS